MGYECSDDCKLYSRTLSLHSFLGPINPFMAPRPGPNYRPSILPFPTVLVERVSTLVFIGLALTSLIPSIYDDGIRILYWSIIGLSLRGLNNPFNDDYLTFPILGPVCGYCPNITHSRRK